MHEQNGVDAGVGQGPGRIESVGARRGERVLTDVEPVRLRRADVQEHDSDGAGARRDGTKPNAAAEQGETAGAARRGALAHPEATSESGRYCRPDAGIGPGVPE